MADPEIPASSNLLMDRGIPLGNSLDTLGRRALHTKVTNLTSEAIPVQVVSGTVTAALLKYSYQVALAVPTTTETTVLSYTAPGGVSGFIQRVDFGGMAIALFSLKINGALVMTKYTNSTQFYSEMVFAIGLKINSGDILTLTVIHARPSANDYNATLQYIEV